VLPCSDVFVCLTVCSSESSTTDPLQGRSAARWSKAGKAAKADAPPSATSRRKAAAPKPAVAAAVEPQAKKAKKAADSASTPKQRKGKNKK
jgi:hypothetical protein